MIKVAIIDDHPAMIFGIAKMLQQYNDFKMVGSYLNPDELLNDMGKSQPDVILLDIQMPQMSGDKLMQKILKKDAGIKFVVLTNFDSPFYLENMIRFGANGYLLKSSPEEQIVTAIRQVFNGEEYITPSLKDHINQLTNYKNRMAKAKLSLTGREHQILQLIADGQTTQSIADSLFLSYHTIENYRDNILMKLDANNTASLIKKAVMLGLVK